MGNLFLSFTIAVCASIGLVSLSRSSDYDFYIGKTLPLIPILYAVIYEFLDHRKKGKAGNFPRSREIENGVDRKTESTLFERLSVGRVITGVGLSFLIKLSLEMFLLALFLRISDQSFSQVYGSVNLETIGRLLRGEHPWLAGSGGVYMLTLIALFTCFLTGLWIGYTSKGKAILEGVLVGAVVTFILSMTNMLILYQKIEAMTVRLADSMGYVLRAGFVIVISLQVLLYGLWSGLVQTGREERMKQAGKASLKRGRR